MSNADRVQLAYAAETGFNDYAAIEDGQRLRFVSESLRQAMNTIQSREIVDDRMVSDIIRTSIRALGDISFELTDATYNDFFHYLLQQSAFSSPIAQVSETSVVVTQSGSTMTLTPAAGTPYSTLTGLVNQWVSLTAGSTAPSAVNLGVFKILTVGGSGASMDVHNPDGIAETKDFKVNSGGQVVNGTTSTPIVIQKHYSDLGGFIGVLYGGCYVSSMSLDASVDQILTGSFGIVGHSAVSSTAQQFDGTLTAATTSDPMNATDDVTALWLGAVLSEAAFTNTTFNISNNPRERQVVGSSGPDSYGFGKFNVSGTVQRYFTAHTEMAEYLADVESALVLTVRDGLGNGYVFECPAVKFTSGQRVAGGENTDIIADLAWEAKKDASEGIMMRIQKIVAAV